MATRRASTMQIFAKACMTEPFSICKAPSFIKVHRHNWFNKQTEGLVVEGTPVRDLRNALLQLKSSDQISSPIQIGPVILSPVQPSPVQFVQSNSARPSSDPAQKPGPVQFAQAQSNPGPNQPKSSRPSSTQFRPSSAQIAPESSKIAINILEFAAR